MKFTTFEEIEAWQEARKLSRMVRVFAQRAIARKDWSWADQISRAALSVMANVAEGNDAKSTTEFIVFLGYAKRSDAEVRSHLYYGLDEGYVHEEEFPVAAELTRKIGAQLAKLMDYLKRHVDDVRLHASISSSNKQTSNEKH